MPDQWEFKILWVREAFFRTVLHVTGGAVFGDFNEETLNRLGEEGWEVCVFTRLGMSRPLILKRRRDRAV